MAGAGWRAFTRERLTSDDFQRYAVDQGHLVFASASARSAALPSPAEGMVSWLNDSKVFEDYVNGAWRRRFGSSASGFTAGSYAGVNNYTLAQLVVNPGRPYAVVVRGAGIISVPPSAAGSLRLRQGTTVKAQHKMQAFSSTVTGTGVNRDEPCFVERSFLVTDGSSQTFDINLDVGASSTLVAYTDDSHSYMQAEWRAL